MILGLKNTIVAVVITVVVGWIYSQYQFKEGIELGKQQQIALQSQVDSEVEKLNQKNLEFIAEKIQGIKIENKTIYNKAVREVITNEKVYSDPNCNLPSSGVSELNKALSPRN